MVPTVIYTAAHSGFDIQRIPLGGAAAIAAQLVESWQKQPPFKVQLLGPSILDRDAPREKDLVHYSEFRYARFCMDFERAATGEILRHDPREVVVLSNDISEGPDFQRLAEKGYRVFTLVHVDVVDYVARMYLRGRIQPETLTRLHRKIADSPIGRFLPRLLRLVFEKQRECVRASRGVIVPSEGMKRILLRCYPDTPPERIHVLPWGSVAEDLDERRVTARRDELRSQYGIPEGARILLTLSRISPEKGQDRLLQALSMWEREGTLPAEGLWVLICGEAAYMHGARFRRRLEHLAARLKNVHVIFPGYVSGVEKAAYFRLADLYVFPSRHESYGLTLMEAYRAGLPVLATHHYGAEELVRAEFGELLPKLRDGDAAGAIRQALPRLLADPALLKVKGQKARQYAQGREFSQTARRLAELLTA